MIEVSSLDHVNIETEDVDRSARFYEDVIGLKQGKRPHFDRPGYWMYADDRPLVHIIAPVPENKLLTGSHDAAFSHFALRITDMKAARAHLDGLGIKYWANQVDDFGISQVFFDDPDGVLIELIHVAR